MIIGAHSIIYSKKPDADRAFLIDAIASPGESYDEQVRFLRTLEELQPDHLRILRAIAEPPDNSDGFSGSPAAALHGRLAGISGGRIKELVAQLNDMRVTNLTGLNSMMTYRGAQDLRHAITSYGKRFLSFLKA
jgi:hypothetical protein